MTNENQGVQGVGLLVAAYVDERGADKALEAMKDAKSRNEFYFDDAAVIRRNADGKAFIDETGDMTSGKAAGVGALVGGVIGILGGPAGIVVGAGAGAAVGALAAATDGGFDQDSLKEIGAALPPGTSALVATTSKDFVEQVRSQTPKAETLTRAKQIASEIETHLSNREDALFSMILTEEGVAATKVTFTPKELAILGVAVTPDGAAAGAGVVTPDGAAGKAGVVTSEGAAVRAGIVTPEEAIVAEGIAVPEEGGDAPAPEEPAPSEDAAKPGE